SGCLRWIAEIRFHLTDLPLRHTGYFSSDSGIDPTLVFLYRTVNRDLISSLRPTLFPRPCQVQMLWDGSSFSLPVATMIGNGSLVHGDILLYGPIKSPDFSLCARAMKHTDSPRLKNCLFWPSLGCFFLLQVINSPERGFCKKVFPGITNEPYCWNF
ncbi:unnamed protein product, partial [Ectocarpus sp. 12 AP-2014]